MNSYCSSIAANSSVEVQTYIGAIFTLEFHTKGLVTLSGAAYATMTGRSD